MPCSACLRKILVTWTVLGSVTVFDKQFCFTKAKRTHTHTHTRGRQTDRDRMKDTETKTG